MLQSNSKYDQQWQRCLELIRSHTSQEEYDSWFKPITPLGFDGSGLRLGLLGKEHVEQIERRFITMIQPIISECYGDKTRIFYSIPKRSESSTTVADRNFYSSQSQLPVGGASQIKNPMVIPGLKRNLIDPNLNAAYTFSNFVDGECNKLAVATGNAVADSPGSNPFNPLYIYGNSGLGKTHIVQAVGHKIRLAHPQLNVLYVSMNRFQSQYQTAVRNKEVPDFIHFYQTIDVLIIDDIQEISGNKSGTQTAFFNIFNHLQLSGKQIILTSDKPPVELRDIEERLLSRFKWGFAAQLDIPSYETKHKIISLKCKKYGTQLPEEVIAYMAENIISNVREIEGVLSAIMANVQFMNRKITIPLAREVLKSYVNFNHKEVTVDSIVEEVCSFYSIAIDQFHTKKRTRDLAQARQIAMYLSKQLTKSSLSSIGSAIGGRNHSTVLHSCKSVANMIETDKKIRNDIEELTKSILS
ncbi:MAG: chromosomal replication initiator protein DnaA [Rikenellaceae bacterium]